MQYIVHKRYKQKALCKKVLNLPYGTVLNAFNNIIATDKGEAVCFTTSENAKIYFARNDDNKGLERGKLTNAIAYSRKGLNKQGYRFNEKQIDIINRHYQRFLRPDCDMIIFNERFFAAPVDELQEMANELNIDVK